MSPALLLALSLAVVGATTTSTAGAAHAAHDGRCHSQARGRGVRRLVLQVGGCRFTPPPCGPPPPPHAPATGFVTKLELRLPQVQAAPALEKYVFFIPDKCRGLGKQLASSVIHACAADVAPLVMVSGSGVGYACVRRRPPRLSPAHVYILQHCL